MKAYITPIENICNANCTFCITRDKKETGFGQVLDTNNLKNIEKYPDVDCYEISGGGEPLLHPKINQIITWSTQRKPTVLYTNGSLIKHLLPSVAKKLKKLTISHHHYSSSIRKKIMGVDLDIKTLSDFINNGVYVRFTLVLVKNGIRDIKQLEKYLNNAKSLGVKEVQVRQLFDYDCSSEIKNAFVETEKILQNLVTIHNLPIKKGKYQTINWKGMLVEFEGTKCACDANVPNLRANGKIYQGWTNTPYP